MRPYSEDYQSPAVGPRHDGQSRSPCAGPDIRLARVAASDHLASAGMTIVPDTGRDDLLTDRLDALEDRLAKVEAVLLKRGHHSEIRTSDTRQGATPYLDAQGAADYLGISLNSLYGVVERNRLVPLRGPRRRYRFTTEMLDRYLGRRDGR